MLEIAAYTKLVEAFTGLIHALGFLWILEIISNVISKFI